MSAFASAGVADVAGEDSGLFLFMMALLFGFVGMIVFGVLILMIIALIVLLLTGAGVFSLSVLVGWYHNSVAKGLNTFLYLGMSSLGIFGGIGILILLSMFDAPWVDSVLFISMILISGALAGWFIAHILKKIVRYISSKITTL